MKVLVDTLRSRGSTSEKNMKSPWLYSQTNRSLNQTNRSNDSPMCEYEQIIPSFDVVSPLSVRGP